MTGDRSYQWVQRWFNVGPLSTTRWTNYKPLLGKRLTCFTDCWWGGLSFRVDCPPLNLSALTTFSWLIWITETYGSVNLLCYLKNKYLQLNVFVGVNVFPHKYIHT